MRIEIYTSGKVEPRNTQHGGFSAVLMALGDDGSNLKTRVISDYEYGITAYKAQALAILEGVKKLNGVTGHDVIVYSRNEALVKAINGEYDANKYTDVIDDIKKFVKKYNATVLFISKTDSTMNVIQQEANRNAVQACYEGANA